MNRALLTIACTLINSWRIAIALLTNQPSVTLYKIPPQRR